MVEWGVKPCYTSWDMSHIRRGPHFMPCLLLIYFLKHATSACGAYHTKLHTTWCISHEGTYHMMNTTWRYIPHYAYHMKVHTTWYIPYKGAYHMIHTTWMYIPHDAYHKRYIPHDAYHMKVHTTWYIPDAIACAMLPTMAYYITLDQCVLSFFLANITFSCESSISKYFINIH